MSDETVDLANAQPDETESDLPCFIEEKFDLLDELYDTDEFLEAETVIVTYSIGDNIFVKPLGDSLAVLGLAKKTLDFVDEGWEKVPTCDNCGAELTEDDDYDDDDTGVQDEP